MGAHGYGEILSQNFSFTIYHFILMYQCIHEGPCFKKQWHQKVNEVYMMEQVITKIPKKQTPFLICHEGYQSSQTWRHQELKR